MLKQQQALLETEGIEMQFTDAAIREISRVAEEVGHLPHTACDLQYVAHCCLICAEAQCQDGQTTSRNSVLHLECDACPTMSLMLQVNTSVDNIGARRLHTVLERIVEEISFDAPEKVSEVLQILS